MRQLSSYRYFTSNHTHAHTSRHQARGQSDLLLPEIYNSFLVIYLNLLFVFNIWSCGDSLALSLFNSNRIWATWMSRFINAVNNLYREPDYLFVIFVIYFDDYHLSHTRRKLWIAEYDSDRITCCNAQSIPLRDVKRYFASGMDTTSKEVYKRLRYTSTPPGGATESSSGP